MENLIAYRLARLLGTLGLFVLLGALAASCTTSLGLIERDEVEDAVKEQFEAQEREELEPQGQSGRSR